VFEDSQVDGILMIYTQQQRTTPSELAEAVCETSKDSMENHRARMDRWKEVQEGGYPVQHNVPTYETPEERDGPTSICVITQKKPTPYETPAKLQVDQAPPKEYLKPLFNAM